MGENYFCFFLKTFCITSVSDTYEKLLLLQVEKLKKISWKRNGVEMMNAPSKNILPLSSTPYVTTRRMCTMGSNHFWRQNTMRFHEIITKYSFCKWWKLKNILWKRKCTEIINAPSNKILPLSSTPYHQTKYIPK